MSSQFVELKINRNFLCCSYKLEQAYRLCPRCERCLKRTLNRVKNNILGSKLHEIGAKGLRALDLQLNNSKTRKNVLRKRHLIVNLCAVSLIVIAMLHLFQTSQTIDINKTKLDAVFSSTIVAPLLVVISYISAMKILIVRIFEKVMTLPYVTVAVTTAKIFISYIYLSLGGSISSFADSKALNEFIEMTAIPKELNIESAEGKALITNTAGCLLSIFVIFMTGLRSPSVLSLVLWSLDMAMPSLWHNKLNPAEALIFDIIKVRSLVLSNSKERNFSFFLFSSYASCAHHLQHQYGISRRSQRMCTRQKPIAVSIEFSPNHNLMCLTRATLRAI